MKLELGKFPVSEVREGSHTDYRDGVLTVDTESLTRLVLENPAIVHARIEIVRPGIPLGSLDIATLWRRKSRLKGRAWPTRASAVGQPNSPAGAGPTGSTVLAWSISPTPSPRLEARPRNWLTDSIRCSTCQARRLPSSPIRNSPCTQHRSELVGTGPRLGGRGRDVGGERCHCRDRSRRNPAEVQTFESPESDADLPRVVYISCHNSPEHYADAVRAYGTSIYGLSRLNAPWLLNPNEWLDGAVAGRDSWILVNNPVIMDLYSRHNRDLIFAGCIAIRTRWSQQVEKNVTSNQAAKIAQQVGATGAVVTWDAGGNDFMEVIRTVQACEQIGINAVFLTFEEHPDNGSPLLEPLPEARAIITTGWGRNELMSESSIPEYDEPLPAVDKVIGRQSIMANQNAQSGQVDSHSELRSYLWVDRYGSTAWSAFDY